jgi:hypothetical protein
MKRVQEKPLEQKERKEVSNRSKVKNKAESE